MAAVAALTCVVCAQALGGSPYERPVDQDGKPVFTGRNSCPPRDRTRIPADEDVNGDKQRDFFMGSWHWDDGSGNDLTVEQWCVAGELAAFSMRIIQSKNGKNTIVAAPGGFKAPEDTGFC